MYLPAVCFFDVAVGIVPPFYPSSLRQRGRAGRIEETSKAAQPGGAIMKSLFLIGRLLFGGFFLYNGINHFKQRKQLGQYAGSKNVPMAEAVVASTGVVLIAGGTSILLGVKPKLGTAAIAGFLAGVSPVMHNFWSVQEPGQRLNEMI